MEIIKDVKALWLNTPLVARKFLVQGIMLLLLWQIINIGYLEPHRVFDGTITNFTTATIVKVLQSIYTTGSFTYQALSHDARVLYNGQSVFRISDGCNALSVFVDFAIFIIVYPINVARKINFIILGAISIFSINVLRCVLLAMLYISHNTSVNVMHHYVFSTIVYAYVLFLWMLFTKKKSVTADATI
jgi:exosortase family protein XrtF